MYLKGLLIIGVILYGSLSQQRLPDFMYSLFKKPYFQFIMYLGIAFLATKDIHVAFIIALLFGIIGYQFNQRQINEAFLEGLANEGFQVEGFEI